MKLSKEVVMVTKAMAERGTSFRRLPGQLGVGGSAALPAERAGGGNGQRREDGSAHGAGRLTGEGRPALVRQMYEFLGRDHWFEGSYRQWCGHLRLRRLKAKRYINSSLIVINEVGFRPLDCRTLLKEHHRIKNRMDMTRDGCGMPAKSPARKKPARKEVKTPRVDLTSLRWGVR